MSARPKVVVLDDYEGALRRAATGRSSTLAQR
jgi:hypothetical protein